MLQRIQSILLLLAAAASLGVFGLPFATTPEPVDRSIIFADADFDVQDHLGMMLLFGLAGLVALAGIFAYRNRPLQMRLSLFVFIANLIGVAFGIIYYMQNTTEMVEKEVNDGLGIFLPAAAMILALLASRYIKKDEKLVRSMDRLR